MSEKTERRRDFDGPVSHDRAREAAQRFIDLAFNNKKGEKPQLRIPADPNDDDLVLTSYIAQQRALTSERDEAVRVAGELRAVLEKGASALAMAVTFMAGSYRAQGMKPSQYEKEFSWKQVNDPRHEIEAFLDALTHGGDLPLKEQE